MQDVIDNHFVEIPKSALIGSLIVHISIPALILMTQVLESMGIQIFPKRAATKQIFQQFIQVDVVDLPDSLLKEKGLVDTSLPVVDKPKIIVESTKLTHDKDIIEEHVTEQKKVSKEAEKKEIELSPKEKRLLRKKELDAALKEAALEAVRERAMQDLVAKSGKTGRGKIAGNLLSKGTSSTGAIGTAKEQYTALIVEAIRQHFSIYPWQQKRGLVGNLHIELFPTGRLRSRKIMKPSGDGTFDSALMQAVDAAQPFPIPEDPALLTEDFDITFIP